MNRLPIPLILLSGFLGSGKTTLVMGLLRTELFRRTALIVNEIGSVGIDQDVLRNSQAGEPVLLSGGCVCCALGPDLGHTLRELYMRRLRGRVPEFDRVLIETTGLADPRPIVHELVGDPWLAAHFRLSTVTTVVGALEAFETLEANPEAVSQVACADRLIVSKCDLSRMGQIDGVAAQLANLNPGAELSFTRKGPVPEELAQSLSSCRRVSIDPLRMEGLAESAGNQHAPNRHNVTTACVTVADPIPWPRWALALDRAAWAGRRDLLRVKGILRVTDLAAPVLIQSVGATYLPPTELPRWPGDHQASRVVLIMRGSGADRLRGLIFECLGGERPAS